MQLILGDCLEKMMDIPDKSIDTIICDLPYGTTACKWDVVIPFEPLWEQYKRIIKDNGAIVLTAIQPFTSMLVMSNLKMFKYDWKWNKNRGGNFVHANYQPLRTIEDVLVFGKFATTYSKKGNYNFNPQMERGEPYNRGKIKNVNWNGSDIKSEKIHENKTGLRYPKSLLNIPNSNIFT